MLLLGESSEQGGAGRFLEFHARSSISINRSKADVRLHLLDKGSNSAATEFGRMESGADLVIEANRDKHGF